MKALKCLAHAVLTATAVDAGRTVVGLQDLQSVFAGIMPPVVQASPLNTLVLSVRWEGSRTGSCLFNFVLKIIC